MNEPSEFEPLKFYCICYICLVFQRLAVGTYATDADLLLDSDIFLNME